MIGCGHTQVMSGNLVWCIECGAYGDAKAVGLTRECKGPPKFDGSYGGAWGQLRKLRRSVHPRTGQPLPPPIDELGKEVKGRPNLIGRYLNLQAERRKARQGEEAASEPRPQAVALVRRTDARQQMEERLIRIRAKEAKARESLMVAEPTQPEITENSEPMTKVRKTEGRTIAFETESSNDSAVCHLGRKRDNEAESTSDAVLGAAAQGPAYKLRRVVGKQPECRACLGQAPEPPPAKVRRRCSFKQPG